MQPAKGTEKGAPQAQETQPRLACVWAAESKRTEEREKWRNREITAEAKSLRRCERPDPEPKWRVGHSRHRGDLSWSLMDWDRLPLSARRLQAGQFHMGRGESGWSHWL